MTAAGRNFLHVKLYLHYCKEIGIDHCNHVPDILEKMYALNFERVFGENAELFKEFIHIFEVLCSLQNPIDEEKLLKIARIHTEERRRSALRILGNELRHFVKNSNGKISFQHKSLSDFLTNTSRKHLNFYVDETNGHKLFAEFLLSSLNLTKEDNLLDVAHHVALSGQIEYENILVNYVSKLNTEKIKIESNFTYLYEAARRINHYNTIALLIKFVESDRVKNRTIDHNMSVKTNMSRSAFIAAMNGHDESLKAFINHGANIRYKNFDLNIDVSVLYNQNNLIFSCKYKLLCGYNVLHITAQKGYTKIVKFLLDQDDKLLLENNSLLLNAFQLAAEHGHVSVIGEILKRDKSFADAHSLHHASENGHSNAVTFLLHYVQDTCVPCNGSIYWRTYNIQHYTDRIVKKLDYTYYNKGYRLMINSFENYVLEKHNVDDWKLVTCDTALNAAVRNGYIETVKVLLNKSVNAINCTAHDGSNALMTAVKYNRTDIFKLLYQKISDLKLKCVAVQIDRSKLFPLEVELLEERKSPDNSSIEHLLAIYDSIEIVQFLVNQGHNTFSWESQDNEGLTAVHYAFCRNSYNFLNFFIFKKNTDLNITTSSHNGSTPFHSAAVCRSLVLQRYLNGVKDGQLSKIPEIFDKQNSSILQYGLNVSVSTEDLIKMGQTGYDEFTYTLFEMSIYFCHNFQHTDMYGRNFLHYAALSGNYWAFLLFSSSKQYKQDIDVLLNMKDKNKRTPLELSFDALPKRHLFDSVKIPHNCSLSDVFYKTCNVNMSVLLLPHEYFIFIVFQHLHFTRNIFETNITDLLIISIQKSRIYPILIIKTYAKQYFSNTISNSTQIPSFISTFDIPLIGDLILNVDKSLRCNTTDSPLHRIIQNDRISLWNFHSLTFLDPLFTLYTCSYLDHCFDEKGYNLLHRAVIGGNHLTFAYLVNKGMSVWIPSTKNESVLEMAVFKAPYTKNGSIPSYYTNGSRFHVLQYIFQKEQANTLYDIGEHVSFDKTATLVLKKFKSHKEIDETQLKDEICKYRKQDLGLIHVAAAKGFLMFLITVKEMYGVDIMKCEDYFGVTPLYLAYIYNQTHVVSWMKKLKLIIKEPKHESKNVLIYNLIGNYINRFDWTCTLRYRNIALQRNQIIKCANTAVHMPRSIFYSLNKNATEIIFKTLRIFVADRGFLTLKQSDVLFPGWDNFNECVGRHDDYFYTVLRQLILFGFDDYAYFYETLIDVLNKRNLKSMKNERFLRKLFVAVNSNKYSHFKKITNEP